MKELMEIVVHQINRSGQGWSGGCSYNDKNKMIYEAHQKAVIGIQDTKSGSWIGRIVTDLKYGLKDLSFDRESNHIWITPGGGMGVYQKLSFDGKQTGVDIPRPKFGFGIFCDLNHMGTMWCADQTSNRVIQISTSTGAVLKEVKLSFPPRGVAKYGNNIWATLAGELGQDDGHLFKVDMDGRILEDYRFPKSKYGHDAGGMTIEDDGEKVYLWVVGGKYTKTFKLDITDTADTPVDPPVVPDVPDNKKDRFLKEIWIFLGQIFGWSEK